jgi:hypothetical protein
MEASLEMARTLNDGHQELEALESLTQVSRNRQDWAMIDIFTLQECIAGRFPACQGIRLVKEGMKSLPTSDEG